MSKRKKKNKRKATQPPRPKMNDGDRLIQTAVQNIKTTH